MHNPVNAANLHAARHRMAFEELFLLQLKLLLRREVDRAPRDAQDAMGIGIRQLDMMHAGSDALGFTLTPAQDRVLKEVPTSAHSLDLPSSYSTGFISVDVHLHFLIRKLLRAVSCLRLCPLCMHD